MIDMAGGFAETALLDWAVRSGLFERTRASSTAAELAVALGVHQHKMEPFLDALSGLGFLERRAGDYRNALTVERHLIEGASDDLRAFVIHMGDQWRAWVTLDDRLRSGEVESWHQDRSVFEDPSGHTRLLEATAQEAGDLPERLAELVDWSASGLVIDAGGGHGRYSAAIATAHPHLACEVWDTPLSATTCERTLRSRGVSHRVRFRPCDLLDDATWRHQVATDVLVANVIANFDVTSARDLLRHAASVLPSGGRVVVVGPWLEETRHEPIESALFSVLISAATHAGGLNTASGITSDLESAGLVVTCQRVGDDGIWTGGKP